MVKRGLIIISILCLISLSGCSNKTYETFETKSTLNYDSEETGTSLEKENEDFYVDMQEAILSGSVSNMVDGGCMLQVGQDNGDVYAMPVDGENQSDSVTVNFNSNMPVVIEYFDGVKKEFEEGKVEDIKINTFIYVFGEFLSENTVNADKIVIFRVSDAK